MINANSLSVCIQSAREAQLLPLYLSDFSLLYVAKEKHRTMSNICVVYVTRDGHSRALAQDISSKTGSEIYEIVDGTNRKGFIGYMNTGRQSMKGITTPIVDPNIALERFDHVVFVQPTWAGSVPPPIRTWFSLHGKELAGKKCSLLVSNKGSAGEPIRAKFEDEFGAMIGRLTAFAVVRENLTTEEKSHIVSEFVAEMERG